MPIRGLRVIVAALFVTAAVVHAASAQQTSAATADGRINRLEQWVSTVLKHDPGEIDDDIAVVGQWSDAELQVLALDATVLVRIIRAPNLAGASSTPIVSAPNDRSGQAPRPIRYTPRQLSRIKEIACAAGGLIDTPPCEWMRAAAASDAVLTALLTSSVSVADRDGNFMLRRGAFVHSDIAMLGLAAPHDVDTGPGTHFRMMIADGQQAALTVPNLHWEFARKLLDQIVPASSIKPAPGRDDMVREWYVATAAWMQSGGHHDNMHIAHALELFPDDHDLAMLAGAQHEAYATSAIQTAVRSAVLPTGVRLEVGSERGELRDAEKWLRRAAELKPDFAEAHIRLGRVLAIMGRDAEAVDHLRRGLTTTTDPLLQYYGSLFLGSVEGKLGHATEARASFEHASTLYPRAQSPLFGLSEVARQAGRRDEALRQMDRIYSLEQHRLDDDPWWTYTYAQGRNADALFDALEKRFRHVDRP